MIQDAFLSKIHTKTEVEMLEILELSMREESI